MPSKDQAQIFIAAVGGVLAVTIFNVAVQSKINSLAAAAIGIGANVLFVTFSSQWLVNSAKRYRPYRRLVDSRASLEGYWLSTANDIGERPYEIAVISFNPDASSYVYSGKSLTRNFEVAAEWKSTHLEVDMEESKIRYFYEGSVETGNSIIQGFGYISFDRAPTGRFMTASGLFVDADQLAGASFHRHTMRRITDAEISACLAGTGANRRQKEPAYLGSDQDYSAIARFLISPQHSS